MNQESTVSEITSESLAAEATTLTTTTSAVSSTDTQTETQESLRPLVIRVIVDIRYYNPIPPPTPPPPSSPNTCICCPVQEGGTLLGSIVQLKCCTIM